MDTEKMKKTCHMIERLSLLIDGELNQKETESMRRHLSGCDICREEYDAIKSVGNLLREIKPVEPSEDFARRFWKNANAMESEKPLRSILENFSWGWRPALGAVAAMLVIAAGTGIYFRTAPSSVDPAGMLIAENMELFKEYEIISNLELFENWEEIIAQEKL